MSTTDRSTRPSPPRHENSKYRNVPGHRVLHLVIDQETFDSLHIQAIRSRMKFTAYMRRFLREAFPYDGPEDSPSVRVTNPT